MGGTEEVGAWPAALRWRPRRFLRHSAHSPVGPGVPPQAHLRWSTRAATGVNDGCDVVKRCKPIMGAPYRPFVRRGGGTRLRTSFPAAALESLTAADAPRCRPSNCRW